MAYYMHQDLFNFIVLSLAIGQHVAEKDPVATRAAMDKAVRSYLDFYAQDDFLPEAEDCAIRTLAWIRGIDPNPQMQIALLAALHDAVRRFQPSGKKKPWRLFNGLYRNSARQPVRERRIQYFKDLALYYLNIQMGKIPS